MAKGSRESKIGEIVGFEGGKAIVHVTQNVSIGELVDIEGLTMGVVVNAWEESLDKGRPRPSFTDKITRAEIVKSSPHLALITNSLAEVVPLQTRQLNLYSVVWKAVPEDYASAYKNNQNIVTMLQNVNDVKTLAEIVKQSPKELRRPLLDNILRYMPKDWFMINQLLILASVEEND